jgi:hypothetical protein
MLRVVVGIILLYVLVVCETNSIREDGTAHMDCYGTSSSSAAGYGGSAGAYN